MSSSPILRLERASKRYCPSLRRSLWYGVQDIARSVAGRGAASQNLRPGEFWALRDVDLELHAGDTLGLIGPNGAGKTTLLRLINQLILPSNGSVSVSGRVGAMIALGTGFNPILTGRENVYINGSVLGMRRAEVDAAFDAIHDFSEIGDFIDSPVKTYSSGMAMRLGFAIAAHLRVDLLLIDEVLAVGDVGFRMKCFRHLSNLTRDGVAVIVVTHNTNDLVRVVERGMVLHKGQVLADCPVEDAVPVYERLSLTQAARSEHSGMPGRLIEIQAMDAEMKPRKEFRLGEDLYLRVVVELEEVTDELRLIVNLVGATTPSIMSVRSPVRRLQSGHHDILLHFPELSLLAGAYYFNVSLYGVGETDFRHRVIYSGDFMVRADSGKEASLAVGGVVKLPHQWS